MAKYEYGVRLEGFQGLTNERKELVVIKESGSVKIKLRGNDGSMVIFWTDGAITTYPDNMRAAGFRLIGN